MEHLPSPAEVGKVHRADDIVPYVEIPWLLVYPDPWGAFMYSSCFERETMLWEVEIPDDAGVAASKITCAKDDWGRTARLYPGLELEIPDPSKLTRRVIFSGCYAAKWRKYLRCADMGPIMRLVACEGALNVLWSHYVDAPCGRLALWGIQTACMNVCGGASEEELCFAQAEMEKAFATKFSKSPEAQVYEAAAACTDPNPASALKRVWPVIKKRVGSDIDWDFMMSLFNSLAAKALDGALLKEELLNWMERKLGEMKRYSEYNAWP